MQNRCIIESINKINKSFWGRSLRCVSCNDLLTEVDLKIKKEGTDEEEDMCLSCCGETYTTVDAESRGILTFSELDSLIYGY